MSKKKVQLSESIEFPEQKIVPVDIEKQVRQGFIEYSMSVITSRALPDVRDGMKPGQRRILYAMYEDNLTYDKPFRKSATTVGNVLGRYHPHGDSAVYGTMVRMAQPFSYRYPLISGHGNFGNVDGDGAAAYRYTEARLSKIADEMMTDIEKNVVDFVPNFDNSRKEPVVLPSRFPNLLVNGSIGIAVGMATNIPTHNLGEVIDGTLAMMDNPDITVPELMQYIKGPDFPTYATIYGTRGIREAYETGRGRIAVRATAEIEEEHRRIVFTEIPYMVNKSMLVASVADLVKDKRILATGYNGAPSGVRHCLDIGCLRDKLHIPSGQRHEICRGTHAEQNSIIQAATHGVSILGCDVYCTTHPCLQCCKMLINCGVKNIFYCESYPDDLAAEMLREAGIRTEIMEKPSPMPVPDPKFHLAGASQGGHGDEC